MGKIGLIAGLTLLMFVLGCTLPLIVLTWLGQPNHRHLIESDISKRAGAGEHK